MSTDDLKVLDSLPVVKEDISYKRFVKVYNRSVKYPDGRVIDWDIVGHGTTQPAFATVFAFNTKTKKVRIIIEYAQGPNQMLYALPAGGFDASKHETIHQTAIHELSEEAHLFNGTWTRLIPEDRSGVAELKWSRNTFVPFVVLDAEQDELPRSRDAEEFIQILDVTLEELNEIILNGYMLPPSVQTCLMALDWLKRNQHIK